MKHRWASAALVLGACQPGGLRADPETCFPEAPLAGQIYVGQISCGEMFIGGGERRNLDYWMANSHFRAVIRHPETSLTLPGLGGGTLIDAAPWEVNDRLHEISPIVADGWLDVSEFEVLPDGLRVAGTVSSLPDRPSANVGDWREITWRITPDEPWLTVEGADGFWIHAAGDYSILEGQVWAGKVVYGTDSPSEIEDLGGAFRVADTDRLMIATPAQALVANAAQVQHISGHTPGAKTLGLFRGPQRVGSIALTDGRWKQFVDARIDGIRAEAGGRPASPVVAPGQRAELGPEGSIVVVPSWTARAHPFLLQWTATDGRSGKSQLDGLGGTLNIGGGRFTLTASGGPTTVPTTVEVVVPDGETVSVGLAIEPKFDPGNHLLAIVGWPSDRDRTFRGTNIGAITGRESRGAAWIAMTPLDEVSQADLNAVGAPILPVKNGTLAAGPDDLWKIWSWGWAQNNARPGHGALNTQGRSAIDSLAVLQGGTAGPRKTAVDLGWLQEVDTPWMAPNRPDFVRLTAPADGDLANWQPWFDWLDANINLIALGPSTWVEVPDPAMYGDIDIIQGFRRGSACATTGALLTLNWGDLVGGDVVPYDARPFYSLATAEISLLGGGALDHVALVHGGGVIYDQWVPNGEDWSTSLLLAEPQSWLIAVAWNDEGTRFATTSPIWLDAP